MINFPRNSVVKFISWQKHASP